MPIRVVSFVLVLLPLGPVALGQEGKDAALLGKALAEWRRGLSHADAKVRLATLEALAEAGGEAAPLLEAVGSLLRDRYPQVRAAALRVVAGLEPNEKTHPLLARALRDRDQGMRYLVLRTLADLGERSLPALAEAMKDAEPQVRLLAVAVLENIGGESKGVLDLLGRAVKDSSPLVRQTAIVALARLGTTAGADPLGPALVDADERVRTLAAMALIELGKEAAAEHFLTALRSGKAPARFTAAQALAHLAEDLDGKGLSALAGVLDDDDARVRATAALGLARAGVKARELAGGRKLVDHLFLRLKDKDSRVRQAAAHALGKVGIDERADVDRLAEVAKDAVPGVRAAAIEALSQYSHDEAPEDWRKHVLDRLADGLLDRDRRVQLLTGKILAGEGVLALPAATRILEKGTVTAKMLAAEILGRLGPDAASAVPLLEKTARSGPAQVRPIAAAALKNIQP